MSQRQKEVPCRICGRKLAPTKVCTVDFGALVSEVCVLESVDSMKQAICYLAITCVKSLTQLSGLMTPFHTKGNAD